ncbi:MAG: Fe-S cluster assembly ATPase SufC [Bdellovibrionales bacterium]|nr:Fe-S cluster assembly ATPase SufC [Bdellovibrionales bacterium]
MLKIQNLKVQIEKERILDHLNLNIKSGEVHVLMGPNGSGKSTLAKVLAGDSQYEILEGQVLYEVHFKEKDLLSMDISQRAQEGVFMAFQYPIEIPGLNNLEFLKTAFNSICKHQGVDVMKEEDFNNFALNKAKELGVDEEFLKRDLNAGFSGGEKKQNEILQMMILSPRLCILDESDSGLDVDSIKKIAKGINRFINKDRSVLLITHYHKLLELIRPDFVHVIIDGRIRKTGNFSLSEKIEAEGYDWISKTSQGL